MTLTINTKSLDPISWARGFIDLGSTAGGGDLVRMALQNLERILNEPNEP